MTAAALLQMRFTVADLARLRLRVGDSALRAGLGERRCEEFVLAAYELACNAVLHGGGGGDLRLSRADGFLRCQVSDDGPGFIPDNGPGFVSDDGPGFVSGDAPALSGAGAGAAWGRGLRLARELADGFDIGAGASGAVVTLMVKCHS